MKRNKNTVLFGNTFWKIYIVIVLTGSFVAQISASSSLLSLKSETTGAGTGGFLVPLDHDPACAYDCRGAVQDSFCGSNGRTFFSECRANQSRCRDPYLTVTPGECKNSVRCLNEKNYKLKVQNLPNRTPTMHFPACTSDGHYAPIQCNMLLGYCWCVTPLGKMIKNSTFQIGSNGTCGKPRSRSKGKRKCKNDAEKAAFALKLRELIIHEYRQEDSTSQIQRSIVTNKHEKMDRNGDLNLSSKEMRKLLRPYRRKLPRACTKVFMNFCDTNGDKQVSAYEWSTCLGVQPFKRNERVPPVTKPGDVLRDGDSDDDSRPTLSKEIDPRPRTAPEVHRVCGEVRRGVIKSKKKNVIIPQCEGTNDMYWTPVQCHEETYCYCVVRETGTPIPNTSVDMGKPDCRSAKLSPEISVPIPGCSKKARSKFLREIQELLVRRAVEKGGLPAPNSTLSNKEYAARWYFDTADENHDRVLTRRENKNFKKLLTTGRKVSKKCLRKFTQHCDRDGNKKTTKEEFVSCLEVRKTERLNARDLIDAISRLKTTKDPDNM